MNSRRFWMAVLSVGALAAWPLAGHLFGPRGAPVRVTEQVAAQEVPGGAGEMGQGDGQDCDECPTCPGCPEQAQGPQLKVVPVNGHVPVGADRQFRVNGAAEGQTLTWELVATSADDEPGAEVATLSEDGLLTALAGGWVIVGVLDDQSVVVAQTDTIWLAGGPTKMGRRGGRAFADGDLDVCAVIPPGALQRPVTVQIRKQTPADLPEQAQGKGRAVSVYKFDVVDAQTGDDVGGRGFRQLVSLTLAYDDTALPDGVTEEQLVAACFDAATGVWRKIPREQTAVDYDNNLITVGIAHASYWAAMVDDGLAEDQATAVSATSWAVVKAVAGR